MPAFEIGVVAALPIGLSWLASHGSSVYFFERYQLYTLPAWSILAAAGLASIRPRLVGLLGLATVVAIGIPDQQKLRSGASHEYTDGRGAARIIADGYKSGDAFAPLLGSQSYMMLDLEIGYYLPDDVHLKDPLVARTAVQRGDLFSTPCKDPVVCLAGTDRIWVVTMGHSSDLLESFPAVEAAALRSSFTETEVKQVRGLTVALLERRAG
jgi:mannosyltransferase